MIYLDYAAHAPADPAVLERFCDMERRFPANPNSVHAAGKAAREEMARVTEPDCGADRRVPCRGHLYLGCDRSEQPRHQGHRTGVTAYRQAYHLHTARAFLGQRQPDRPCRSAAGRSTCSPSDGTARLTRRNVLRASASGYRSRCHLRGGQRAWYHSAGKRNRSAVG